jgi:hypothetical protein
MKKTIVALSLLFVSFISWSQEEILFVKNELKTSNLKLEQSFLISDDLTNNLSITLKDKENLYSYLYNDNLEKLAGIKSKTLANKYKILLGNSIDNLNYSVYFANNKKTKFGVYTLNFENQTANSEEIELKLVNEKFLQSVSLNNSFYIFTILSKKSILKIYEFKNNSFEEHVLDFSKERFVNKENAVVPLYNALQKDFVIKLEKIESQNPNSIESASNFTKLYSTKEGVRITLDVSSGFTQIVQINLNNYNFTIENIKKPYVHSNSGYKKSNSFIYGHNLFHLTTTPKQLIFSVTDLKSKKVIKEYKLEKEDAITFKNSNIIQEGGVYKNLRELEKTKQFLRKISKANVGIAIYKLDEKFQITLGGYKEMASGGMGMPGFGAIPMASFGGLSLAINPTMFAYSAYKRNRSTYINCLFDSNFEHLEGDISENIFDKISDFTDKNESTINAETIFIYKNDFILGTSIKGTKHYRLLKFKE